MIKTIGTENRSLVARWELRGGVDNKRVQENLGDDNILYLDLLLVA